MTRGERDVTRWVGWWRGGPFCTVTQTILKRGGECVWLWRFVVVEEEEEVVTRFERGARFAPGVGQGRVDAMFVW